MLKILNDLCKFGTFASFYTDASNTEKFIYGKVIAVNEAVIVFHAVSPDGEDDGIVLMPVERVFRVEEKGQYTIKMSKLLRQEKIIDYALNVDNNAMVTSVLLYAQSNNHIVSVELLDSGYDNVVGFVNAIEDGQCKVQLIDEYGFADGFSYFFENDITQISILSESEKRIERLWSTNK